MNNRIKYYIRQKKVTFFIITIILLIIFPIIKLLINNNIKETFNNMPLINYIFILLFILVIIILSITTTMQIKKLNTLLNIKPIKCIIEDFVYIGYTHDGKRRYEIFPIVKNMEDNRLYFTFDKYSLIRYNKKYFQMGASLIKAHIYRKDNSIVKVGDVAYLYIKKSINLKVDTNQDKNIVYLNNKKISFSSNKNSINIFNNLNYFEGIVDIENNIEL